VRRCYAWLLVAGCGRIGFDDASRFEPVPLIAGGHAHRIAVAETGTLYAMFSNRGAFRWAPAAQQWTACAPFDGAFGLTTFHATVFASSGVDVLRSDDDCATWRATGLGQTANLTVAGDGVLAVTATGLWRLSTAWSAVATPLDSATPSSIAADASGAHLVLGSRHGGVAISSDGGATWTVRDAGLTSDTIETVAIDPSASDHVFALTTPDTFASNDAGQTWTYVNPGGDALAIDPFAPSRVAMFSWGHLQLSTDGGMTFAPEDRRSPEMQVAGFSHLVADPAVPGRLYAATARGVFASPDDGQSWSPMLGDLQAWRVASIAIDPDTGTTFAATDGGLLRGDSSGWTLESRGVTYNAYADRVVVTDVSSPRLLIGGRNFYTSDDDGRTLTFRYNPDQHGGDHVYAIARRGSRVWLGTNEALVHSDDLTSWVAHDLGGSREIHDIALPDDQTIVLATTTGMLVSTDGGVTFRDLGGPLAGHRVDAIAQVPDGWLVATDDGVWQAAVLDGSWRRAGLDGIAVTGMSVDAGGVIVATSKGVFESATATPPAWTRVPGVEDRHPLSIARGVASEILIGTSGYGLFREKAPGS
jgi:hypothetical protein